MSGGMKREAMSGGRIAKLLARPCLIGTSVQKICLESAGDGVDFDDVFIIIRFIILVLLTVYQAFLSSAFNYITDGIRKVFTDLKIFLVFLFWADYAAKEGIGQ